MYTMEQITKNISPEWLKFTVLELEEQLELTNDSEIPDLDILKDKTDQSFSAYISRNEKLLQAKDSLDIFIVKGKCKTCHRTFGNPDEQKKHLVKLKQTIENCKEAEITAKKHHSSIKKEYNDAVRQQKIHEKIRADMEAAQKYHKLEKLHQHLASKTLSIKEDCERLERAIALFNARITVYNKTKELREQAIVNLNDKEEYHRQLESRQCPLLPNITQLQIETENARNKVALLDSKIEKMHSRIAKWSLISGWAGNRGIQTYAMERTMQKLATYTTKWLRIFFKSDVISLEVSFDEKERLQRHLQWPNHAGVLSGGQWRRAQLASFMAWKDIGPYQFPLLIMDEACTSMDSEGIHAVQCAFRDWCDEDEMRTCFFITHEPGQHRDTSIYDNHTIVKNKRGRASVITHNKKRKF